MEPIERYPNCTWSNNDDPDVDLKILQIDHAIRRKYDDPGVDLIRYTPYDNEMEILPLHPFAIVEESLAVQFWDNYMLDRDNLDEIIEIVDQHIPKILKKIRWSRKRDRLLGRNTDDKGNVITDSRLWKYDPVYTELAGILGFDCNDPILLSPKVYDFHNGIEQMTASCYCGDIIMQGELVNGDGIAMSFNFERGPLQEITLDDCYTKVVFRGLTPPHSIQTNLVGKPLSAILSGNNIPKKLLDRRIEEFEVESDTDKFEVILKSPSFTKLIMP